MVHHFGRETGWDGINGGVERSGTGCEFGVGLLWCVGCFLSFSFGGVSFLFGYFGTEYA